MRTAIASVLCVLLTASTVASAAPTGAERAMAEGLFREGKQLLAAGRVSEACDKLAASYRIDPAGGTLMNLAACHEREGKTATAWGEFNDALAWARQAHHAGRQTEATARIAALEARLAHISVTAPSGLPIAGLEIKIDDVRVDAGSRTAVPVDPGAHAVLATAPGRLPWKVDVVAREGMTESVVVPDLPRPVQAVEAPPPSSPSWRVPVGASAIGIGALGLAVGAYFGAHAMSLGRDVSSDCPGMKCTPAGFQALNDGRSAASAADGLLVVGGLFAAAGAVVLIVVRPVATAPAVGLTPRVTRDGAFLGTVGSF